jgi:hypothetical protein
MKVSRIKWAQCPYCNVTLNGYEFYPMGILMYGDSSRFSPYHCEACKKEILLSCRVEVTLEASTIEED